MRCGELRVRAIAEIAGIDLARVADRILAAEGGGDRDAVADRRNWRNDARRAGSSPAPPTIATGRWRPSSSSNKRLHRTGSGASASGATRGPVDRLDLVAQHVLGQRQHHRARPPGSRRRDKRARHIRGCAARPRSAPPIWRSARTWPGSRSPGTPRGRGRRGRRRRRTGSSACESWKATWTPIAGVGRAGAAGDEGDSRPAGHLAVGARPCRPTPPSCRQTTSSICGRVVQRVEHGEEAFARHGEDAVAALDAKLVDEDAAAGA